MGLCRSNESEPYTLVSGQAQTIMQPFADLTADHAARSGLLIALAGIRCGNT